MAKNPRCELTCNLIDFIKLLSNEQTLFARHLKAVDWQTISDACNAKDLSS